MKQRKLYKLFKGQVKNGWDVKKEDFPESIEERFFPEPENIFKALSLIKPKDVKYIIFGQDPYYSETNGIPDATGVAFATNGKKRHALGRIMNKVGNEKMDLTDWIEKRGVLLLNASLTVPAGNKREFAGAHLNGEIWDDFIKSIVSQVKEANPNVKLIAWGVKTRQFVVDKLGIKPFVWSHHPCASTTGKDSFDEFWKKDIGCKLRMI
jgi:uracil-DNA glycosylase